jgi:hypothetical protein
VDVVVTGRPPACHLDGEWKGCGYLLRELRRNRPFLVVFGHTHEGYGEGHFLYDGVQAAWEIIVLGHGGFFVLLGVVFQILLGWLGSFLWRSNLPSTKSVNAAVVHRRRGDKLTEPITIVN